MVVSGCVTTSVSSNLSLGMSKEEVLAKCGKPFQAGAIKDSKGQLLESFHYKQQTKLSPTAVPIETDTYVYFTDGRVVYYGNSPSMPIGVEPDE